MCCEELCVVKAFFEIREDTAIRARRQKWADVGCIVREPHVYTFWIISKEAHSALHASC